MADVAAPLARYVTIKAFATATGLSEGAVRQRIERGIWLEKKPYRRANDGRVWIDMREFEKRIEAETGRKRTRCATSIWCHRSWRPWQP